MRRPTVTMTDNQPNGFWRIIARPLDGSPVEITLVRGHPTSVGSLTTTDPFGPAEATLSFPGITILDPYGPGSGDLWWLRPEVDIDIVWQSLPVETIAAGGVLAVPDSYENPTITDLRSMPLLADIMEHLLQTNERYSIPNLDEAVFQTAVKQAERLSQIRYGIRGDRPVYEPSRFDDYVWEGYATGFSWSYAEASGTLNLQCLGAARQMDNYLAMPEYLSRPITFEHAIVRQFDNKPGLRLKAPQTYWPQWWAKTYVEDAKLPWYYKPVGVSPGQPWTGMLTRETGQREAALTGYIQGLLAAMWTERGQWTLGMAPGRVPVLYHREASLQPNDADVYLDVTWPGVSMTMNVDYTQRANVVYGQGRSLAGVTFSGMQVTPSGLKTYYEPFASLPAVHPEGIERNEAYSPQMMRKEINIDFYQGMSADDARVVAEAFLRRSADPGMTGTIEFSGVDPREVITGAVFPRQLLRAGMNVRLDGLQGMRPGPVFHIAESTVEPANQRAQITVDSRFRDQLTVQEIEQRGRDALYVPRLLTVGSYQPNIPDQLLPWDYNIGSGAIPLGSKDYFDGAPVDMQFPWAEWVRQHPPSNPSYRDSFIRIGPVDKRNATQNWNRPTTRENTDSDAALESPIAPLLLSQAGDVKLIQVAAFWEDGTVAPVSFHLGIYNNVIASAEDMPKLTRPQGEPTSWRYNAGKNRKYADGQAYPFFPGAFERYDEDGNLFSDTLQVSAEGIGMEVAYGNYYARAGYWPNSYEEDQQPTGLLVNESGFSYPSGGPTVWPGFDPTGQGENTFDDAGRFAVLIYCDDQGERPVYFLGRAWRREYGTS